MSNLKFEVSQVAGNINCNLSTINELAQMKADEYKDILVTEDTTKAAKDDIAELRKFQKEIDTARKIVKSEFVKPLTVFEDECKKVISYLETPIQYMDKQVKEFEQLKKQEKKLEVETLFIELTKGYEEYLPLNRFYKAQWENVSTTIKSIEKEVCALVDQASMAVSAIKSTESEFLDKGLESLKTSLDVSIALNVIKRYEAQKKEILEREERRKQQEEAERQRKEADRIQSENEAREREVREEQLRIEREETEIKKVEQTLQAEITELEEAFVIEEEPFIVTPKIIKKIYIVEATEERHKELESMLVDKNITFESEVM
jgi:hypothetical protein